MVRPPRPTIPPPRALSARILHTGPPAHGPGGAREGTLVWTGIVVLVLLTALTAFVGGLASVSAPAFYAELAQPSWSPPPSVFGPVWTTLFAMMAVAAGLVWRERARPGARAGIGLYVAQLALNALWSWIFFAWRSGTWAVVEILVLWLAIAATLVAFWRVRPVAGALLLPYLAWVTFATALTITLWRMNPGLL